jgi:hypothetical protein
VRTITAISGTTFSFSGGLLKAYTTAAVVRSGYLPTGFKLSPSDNQGASLFGMSVCLSDTLDSANTVVVGAPFDLSYQGGTWTFDKLGSTWTQEGTHVVGTGATSLARYTSGTRVCMDGTGNRFATGNPLNENFTGAAWVFRKISGVWTQENTTKLVGTGGVGYPLQGSAVHLSVDGKTLAVGAPGDDNFKGAVWIYIWNGSAWTQQGSKLTPINGQFYSRFGNSVSLTSDGNTLLVGGPGDNMESGAIWRFQRTAGVWACVETNFLESSTTPGNVTNNVKFSFVSGQFGHCVDTNNSGDMIYGSAPYASNIQGLHYAFSKLNARENDVYSRISQSQGTNSSYCGFSSHCAKNTNYYGAGQPFGLANHGATAIGIISSNEPQLAESFSRSISILGSDFSFQETGQGASRQGFTVALSGDGKFMAMSGPWDFFSFTPNSVQGAIWIFSRSSEGSSWSSNGFKLMMRGNAIGDNTKSSSFGLALSFNHDGSILAVGAPSDGTSNTSTAAFGSAYLFVRTTNGSINIWTQIRGPTLTTLTVNRMILSNNYGTSVVQGATGTALDFKNNMFAVGSPEDTTSQLSLNATGVYTGSVTCMEKIETALTFAATIGTKIITVNSGTWVGGVTWVTLISKTNNFGCRCTISLLGANTLSLSLALTSSFEPADTLVYLWLWHPKLTPLVSGTFSAQGRASFGSAVALSQDGVTLAIGAKNDALNTGSTFIAKMGSAFSTTTTLDSSVSTSLAAATNFTSTTFVVASATGLYPGCSILVTGATQTQTRYIVSIAGTTLTLTTGGGLVGTFPIGTPIKSLSTTLALTSVSGLYPGNYLSITANGISESREVMSVISGGTQNFVVLGSSLNNTFAAGATVIAKGWTYSQESSVASQTLTAGVTLGTTTAFSVTSTTGYPTQQNSGQIIQFTEGAITSFMKLGGLASATSLTITSAAGTNTYPYSFTTAAAVTLWHPFQAKLVGTGATGAAQQGTSVALSGSSDPLGNGSTLIVGGPRNNNNLGAVWTFTRSGSTWTQESLKVPSSYTGSYPRMGESVSLSSAATVMAVGGTGDDGCGGATWTLTRSGGVWTQTGKLVGTGNSGKAAQGCSVSLSASGNSLAVGGKNDNVVSGAAWAFEAASLGNFAQLGSKLIGEGSWGYGEHGTSMSMSGDARVNVFGGPMDHAGDGVITILTVDGRELAQSKAGLKTGTGATGKAHQGYSVSIATDASAIVSYGPGDDGGKGAAWVFVP